MVAWFLQAQAGFASCIRIYNDVFEDMGNGHFRLTTEEVASFGCDGGSGGPPGGDPGDRPGGDGPIIQRCNDQANKSGASNPSVSNARIFMTEATGTKGSVINPFYGIWTNSFEWRGELQGISLDDVEELRYIINLGGDHERAEVLTRSYNIEFDDTSPSKDIDGEIKGRLRIKARPCPNASQTVAHTIHWKTVKMKPNGTQARVVSSGEGDIRQFGTAVASKTSWDCGDSPLIWSHSTSTSTSITGTGGLSIAFLAQLGITEAEGETVTFTRTIERCEFGFIFPGFVETVTEIETYKYNWLGGEIDEDSLQEHIVTYETDTFITDVSPCHDCED
jgi:hypothetical protein